MGKQREIYISSYFGMFSEYIHDFEFFIFIFIGCLVLGVWVLRKCGKAKENRFFFLLILVCSLNIYMILSFFFFFYFVFRC